MGERVRIRFLHSPRAFSRLTLLEGVSNTHWAEKQPKKPPATQANWYLYIIGGTPPHGHLVPIRLLWLAPAKKSRTLCYEKALQHYCGHIAMTNRHISWLFHQVWKRPLKPTEKRNCEANKKCLSNVVSFAPKMASSCFKILSWRYLKIPAIKFDPSLLNTATQPLNTPTFLWPRCVSVCLWQTDFLSLSLMLMECFNLQK